MTTTRPTVTRTRKLEADLEACRRQLATVEHDLDDLRTHQLRQSRDEDARQAVLDAEDAEAIAYAECVAAFTAMGARERRQAERQAEARSRVSDGTNYYGTVLDTTWESPTATAIGRVLLHLAHRYHLAIEPAPRPEPPRRTAAVMVVPQSVAEAMSEIPAQAWEQCLAGH